ncbi:hypothetical protein NNJEOMEG_00894 [Fundidesulfovibrio magnetotacticus]|uniref:Solute-binding protein family 3/N-terminal domain-containing protein n=2 Tax=Fundidesulfovibrio magnetotacticus TaxID=2730080 RepID=A0A6V8LXR2_9BACT|nr:hypothetical protein NNJEOMEG_00894 [Fundidesulfovibrio magnetotacticus]
MRTAVLSLLLFASLALAGGAHAEQFTFTVQSDLHLEFAREICLEALKKAGVDARFEPFPVAPERRLAAEMASGKLHLAFLPPSVQRLLPEGFASVEDIRIPLERGLLSYRVCLLRGAVPELLKDVRTLDDLKRVTVGQGFGWGDVDVYKAAGVPVVEVPFTSPSDPLRALAAGHFDVLPLGADEYAGFLDIARQEGYGLAADRHLVIHYPWYRYVWVSRTAPDAGFLLEALTRGLDIVAADGSFVSIYEKYKGRFDPASLRGRTVIDLPSPYAREGDIPPRYRHLLIVPR